MIKMKDKCVIELDKYGKIRTFGIKCKAKDFRKNVEKIKDALRK